MNTNLIPLSPFCPPNQRTATWQSVSPEHSAHSLEQVKKKKKKRKVCISQKVTQELRLWVSDLPWRHIKGWVWKLNNVRHLSLASWLCWTLIQTKLLLHSFMSTIDVSMMTKKIWNYMSFSSPPSTHSSPSLFLFIPLFYLKNKQNFQLLFRNCIFEIME